MLQNEILKKHVPQATVQIYDVVRHLSSFQHTPHHTDSQLIPKFYQISQILYLAATRFDGQKSFKKTLRETHLMAKFYLLIKVARTIEFLVNI